MAENVGSLYLRLGLNLSELETGFVTASQTVAANISRLNRESNLVRIRSEIEIAGLDETADAERILQIRTNALNQQMQIQRDRIRILDAEYQSLVQSQGANSTAAQRAAVRIERERLALANLERELRNLNDTANSSNSNGLFGGLQNILPKLQAAQIVVETIKGVMESATEFAEEFIENFREIQNQSYELNMPFEETRDFLRELKLAGGDIGDFEGYIRGITDAYVKGEWDDPEFIALRKYGAEITDATGRLKDFKDITEEVYQAWLKADAAGEGIEFLQLTGGEAGVRDAIQLFKRYGEAKEDAAKIFKAEIDAEQLHELDRVLGRVEVQSEELKTALGDIFVPAAQAAGEKFFQMLHDGTEYLVENKDELQRWGFIAAETFSTIADNVKKGYSAVGEFIKEAMKPKNTTGDEKVDKMMSGMDWRYGSAQTPYGVDKMTSGITEATKSYGIFSGIIERATDKQKEFNLELEKTKTVADTVAKGLAALSEKPKDNNPLNQYDAKRITAFRQELEDLKIELEFGDNDYKKSLAQLELWTQRELNLKNFLSDKEREAIEALSAAKKDLIDQEYADKIQQYWQNAADIQFEMTHTAFEKELHDIELWKDAQQEKADTAEEVAGIIAESAAKEAQAFEREVDRIKGLTQSLEDEIFEMENSQYEVDKRRALQKAQKALDEGVDSSIVQRFLDDKFKQLNTRASKDKDYKKSPDGGAMQCGGNGIMVISGDQIIDDGLIQSRQVEIGLLTDENQIRAQLSANLSDQARELITANQALRNYSAAQKVLPPAEKSQSGFQIIEGDKVVAMPEISTAPIQEFNSALQQSSAQITQFGVPEVSTEPLQNFSATIEQLSSKMQKFNPLESMISAGNIFSEKLKQMEQNLPAEYFKTLAGNMKGASDVMVGFSNDLIDAHGRLINSLSNMPSKEMQTNLPTNGLRQLSTSTQDFVNAQEAMLSRQTRELEQLPTKNKGMNLGFDMDTAGTVLGLGALLAGIGGAPITAPIAAGITALSALGGLAKGTYDNSTAPAEPNATLESIPDLTPLITPLTSIDGNVQSVLQDLQNHQETTISFETIVTPLNNIENIIQNILSAIGNAKQPDLTVSPDIKIDLGGAYVFDEKMKSTLVDDITDKIVSAITEAVKSATGNRSYGYSA